MTVSQALKNVIVVGGSFVGLTTAQQTAALLPATHRVLLIEPHSHFHFLFVFPRFAVVPGHEHKAFVPYSGTWSSPAISIPHPDMHAVVRARVMEVHRDHVRLDRQWQGSDRIPFEYITLATGTRLRAPGNIPVEVEGSKPASVRYLQGVQQQVKSANAIVIIGGGAVGVQMATDLKDLYPEKKITLVQSRDRVMPRFDAKMHEIVAERFRELGVELITNSRVAIPPGGFPETGETFRVQLNDGRTLETQLVIHATGQAPNNELIRTLPPSKPDSILNPANGFIRVKPTLQFSDPAYPNFFAVGDIADTGSHKAARPGLAHAAAVGKNIAAMVNGQQPTETISYDPGAIHLTLGLQKHVMFRNPGPGEAAPDIAWHDDGVPDMNIESIWPRQGVRVNSAEDYHRL